MKTCSEPDARPVELAELEQLGPPPSQDPVLAAQQIIDAGHAQADRLRTQAVEDGRAEGVRLGREDAAAELAPAVAALEEVFAEARALRDAIVDDAEARAVELVRAAGIGSSDAHFEVHAERRVARGGGLVRTTVGEVDAQIECKLDAVRALVTAELSAG